MDSKPKFLKRRKGNLDFIDCFKVHVWRSLNMDSNDIFKKLRHQKKSILRKFKRLWMRFLIVEEFFRIVFHRMFLMPSKVKLLYTWSSSNLDFWERFVVIQTWFFHEDMKASNVEFFLRIFRDIKHKSVGNFEWLSNVHLKKYF